MQSPNYQRNTHKAAQAEKAQDFPMAAVYWHNASESECTAKQRHWANCRYEHCTKMIGDEDNA